MGEVNWTSYATAANLLTTELNSLADGSESSLGSELDNTTNKDMLMDVYIDLASLNPTGSPYIVLNVYRSVDGTNYPDNPNEQISIPFATGSATKHETRTGIVVHPGKLKCSLTNELNVALAASGNTVKTRVYSPTVA